MKADPDLVRRAKSAVEERRPVCPSCGTRAPRDCGAEWFKPHEHRCPHGEPCPGFAESVSAYLTACAVCDPQLPIRSSRWTGGDNDDSRAPEPEEAAGEADDDETNDEPASAAGGDVTTGTRTIACGACGRTVVGAHPRRKYCEPCSSKRLKESKRRSDAKKRGRTASAKRSKPKRSSAAKTAAGRRLNEHFEGAGGETAPPASAEPKTSSIARTLAELERVIADRQHELHALMTSANVLARLQGEPAPYPDLVEVARAE